MTKATKKKATKKAAKKDSRSRKAKLKAKAVEAQPEQKAMLEAPITDQEKIKGGAVGGRMAFDFKGQPTPYKMDKDKVPPEDMEVSDAWVSDNTTPLEDLQNSKEKWLGHEPNPREGATPHPWNESEYPPLDADASMVDDIRKGAEAVRSLPELGENHPTLANSMVNVTMVREAAIARSGGIPSMVLSSPHLNHDRFVEKEFADGTTAFFPKPDAEPEAAETSPVVSRRDDIADAPPPPPTPKREELHHHGHMADSPVVIERQESLDKQDEIEAARTAISEVFLNMGKVVVVLSPVVAAEDTNYNSNPSMMHDAEVMTAETVVGIVRDVLVEVEVGPAAVAEAQAAPAKMSDFSAGVLYAVKEFEKTYAHLEVPMARRVLLRLRKEAEGDG